MGLVTEMIWYHYGLWLVLEHHDKSNDKLFWFLPTEDESGGPKGV